MLPGNLYRLKNWFHYFENGGGWTNYIAERDQVAIVMLLGSEPKKADALAQKLDIDLAMNDLGWYRLGPDGRPIVVGCEHLHPDCRTIIEIWRDEDKAVEEIT